jgi:cystathionine beta-lyase
MVDDFDRLIERRGSDSIKWQRYGPQVLPLWVADMDFAAPRPVLQALHERLAHGILGYGAAPARLAETLCERLHRLYRWAVTPDQMVFLPGLVCGLNLVCRAVGENGDGVLVQTPVYPPFLTAPGLQGRQLRIAPLASGLRAGYRHYEPDYSAFETAVTARTRLFLLCHPHNPVGRIFTPQELTRMAEICTRHDLVICSDEIHSDLVLEGRHQPMAALSPDIARRCITLMAPSKTFNLAGLGVSFAIVQNPELRGRLKTAAEGIVAHVNILGFAAMAAAYTQCDDWLRGLLDYLRANRDHVLDYVTRHLPTLRQTRPEATYLAWLDCREAGIEGDVQQFFIEQAGVAFNDGATFGPGGEGFVRLNFGCPRALLTDALERVRGALAQAHAQQPTGFKQSPKPNQR